MGCVEYYGGVKVWGIRINKGLGWKQNTEMLLRKVGRLGLKGGVKLVMILRLCGCVELKRCGVGVDAKGV